MAIKPAHEHSWSGVQAGDLALIGVGSVALLLALAALAAVGAASFVFGGGWIWPHGVPGAARQLGGLLTGHPARGLDPARTQRLPGAAALWTVVTVFELCALGLAVLVARVATGYVRPPGARSGLATRADAARALGRERLTRQRVAEIRPDLRRPPRTERS